MMASGDAPYPDTAEAAGPATLHVLRLPASPPASQKWGDAWLLDDSQGEIENGDLVHFEELLTGAGECEGLRWALPAEAAGAWRLVPGDVEFPVFPADQGMLVKGRAEGATLRQLYEPALEALMALQHVSFSDLLGGDTTEFWAAPDTKIRYPGLDPDSALWRVDIAACTRVATLRFQNGASGN
eukprot:jgi/Tetstr1/439132/TSEL_027584.t1